MKNLARTAAVLLIVVTSLTSTGCLHTLTQTYADYPPSAWEPPHTHPQGNPSDG